MTLRQWTIVFIISCTVFLIGWDVIAYVKGGSHATISIVILEWSQKFPLLPFSFGVLCGHLFVPIKVMSEGKPK